MTKTLVKPEYRVRLFLSVDLTGSTAFKSKNGTTNFEWLKAFQKFYGEFPARFTDSYKNICTKIPEISDNESRSLPKVWKTIGDEILFVNRVESISHLGAYVRAFSDTLISFGQEIASPYKLNTKGNGWIAAFPSPNCSIHLSRNGTNDPLNGGDDLPNEDFEKKVDDAPHDYDFLGKGIDGGFRISRNSTIDSFTISPALAHLLCIAKKHDLTSKFDFKFKFHEPQQLKGVVGGKHYPIISIDTSRDQKHKTIKELQASLLNQPVHADDLKLTDYLERYMDYYDIEMPALKHKNTDADVPPPVHYEKYIEKWETEETSLRETVSLEMESANASGDTDIGSVPGEQDGLSDAAETLKSLIQFIADTHSKKSR
jgi:hypothetical protein